jgi:hypothetical protein
MGRGGAKEAARLYFRRRQVPREAVVQADAQLLLGVPKVASRRWWKSETSTSSMRKEACSSAHARDSSRCNLSSSKVAQDAQQNPFTGRGSGLSSALWLSNWKTEGFDSQMSHRAGASENNGSKLEKETVSRMLHLAN